MENFNLGIGEMYVITETTVFPNPVPPKTSVIKQTQAKIDCAARLSIFASLINKKGKQTSFCGNGNAFKFFHFFLLLLIAVGF